MSLPCFPNADNFTGIVHVYQAYNETAFKLLGYVRAPPGSNMNFGISNDVYGQRIVVGANADSKFILHSLFNLFL